jgi:glycogen synthase
MRVLFISNFFPPHHIGGYEELCEEVRDGLNRRGHEVAVLTSHHGDWSSLGDVGLVFRSLHPEIDYEAGGILIQFLKGRRGRTSDNRVRAQQVLSRFDPEIVMVWGMWNLSRDLLSFLESRDGPPIVFYLADYWPLLPDAFTLHWQEPARRWVTRWPKRVIGLALRRWFTRDSAFSRASFDHVLCVSAAVRDHLRQNGVNFGEVRVVHNGIRVSSRPPTTRVGNRSRSGQLRIVYAGRLSPEKGLATALGAIATLRKEGRDVSITVAGSGTPWAERELSRLVQELGISSYASFLGRVERSRLPALLASSDVMVVPSLWADPLPRTIQEGMDAGLVVVASEVGGIPEIIEDGINGLLFTPGDANSLARQLERLQDDPQLVARLQGQGIATVRSRFKIERTIQEVDDYLSSVLARTLMPVAQPSAR